MRRLLLLMLLQCTPIPDPCEAAGSCAEEGATVAPPAACDAAADPKDAPACVDDSFAYFVSSRGTEDGDGTKARPLRALSAGVAKAAANRRSRIYVCEGRYPEPLLTSVSVFGGFDCAQWIHNGSKPVVGPVTLDGSVGVRLADLRIEAPDASSPGASSIALIANASTATMSRLSLVAGAGNAGADGVAGKTESIVAVSSGSLDANANPAAPTSKSCTCASGGLTSGGAPGRLMGSSPAVIVLATPGLPAGSGGAAGPTAGFCTPGLGLGGDGSGGAAAPFVPPSPGLGTLSAQGWTPATAPNATLAGAVGQGGGGGGFPGSGGPAYDYAGGGGCGGCPGTPGTGGHGGGASIALISYNSTLTLVDVSLETKLAGNGGAGGKGGDGAPGGSGGVGQCSGGNGGKGGQGSSAPGGPGGISVGILWVGAKPEYDPTATVFVLGPAGAGGAGGAPENPGPPGLRANDVQGPEL